MSIHPEPGGGVSFRVIIGTTGQSAKCDLLELIISAEDIEQLNRSLTGHYVDRHPGDVSEHIPMQPFPCHVGLRRNAEYAAA